MQQRRWPGMMCCAPVLLLLFTARAMALPVECQTRPVVGGCTDATGGQECRLADNSLGLCRADRSPIPKCLCQPPLVCVFDTNGDGTADLTLGDEDGDGLCEWPAGTTTLPGTLRFTAGTPVEFHGSTTVIADRIVVEPDGLLSGEPATLTKLVLIARIKGTSDIVSEGTLDLRASDDVVFQATGSVDLTGFVHLAAGDVLAVKASQGNVTIAPAVAASEGAFDLFARNRVEISAKGANGSIDIAGARVGSFRIIVRTKANVSVVGPKQLVVRDGAQLVTDLGKTGLPNSSNVQLDATGRIVLTGAFVDAGTNMTIRTQRTVDDVCLSQSTTLEAQDGRGRIYLGGVHGTVFDDGTTTFVGLILGDPPVPGTCP